MLLSRLYRESKICFIILPSINIDRINRYLQRANALEAAPGIDLMHDLQPLSAMGPRPCTTVGVPAGRYYFR